MKRVLVLSSKSPYPLCDGAAIRTHQSIRLFFELGYMVDVLYLSETDDLATVKQGLSDICHNIYRFNLSKCQSYFNVLMGLPFRQPLQVCYFKSRKAAKWVKTNGSNYDIVYCNNIRTAYYAYNLKTQKIIDYVDAYSMNYQTAREKTKGIWRLIYTIDFPRCNYYEQKILHQFDKKAIISDVDREYILANADSPSDIHVIENYAHVDDRRVAPDKQSHDLVFVGAMNYEPNVTAVVYFCKTVMPLLLQRYPDIKFYIVGKTPTDQVKALASDSVIVTGYVDSTWEYLNRAAIVVTPMQSGSGLQNKVLQAMAVGACVVTTPKGFEGLYADDGQPIVAKNSREMASIILHLLEHPEEREQIGLRSVEYVKKHYSVEGIKRKFAEFLDS